MASHSYLSLIAAMAAAIAGCAPTACRQGGPHCGSGCQPLRTVCAIYHGELADEVVCCGGCCDQSRPKCYEPTPCAACGPDCYYCPDCPLLPLGFDCPACHKPQPGPPPVTLRPPMPPKFLPVPVHPVLSPVRPDAPEPMRGDVEVGYDKRLTFPARD